MKSCARGFGLCVCVWRVWWHIVKYTAKFQKKLKFSISCDYVESEWVVLCVFDTFSINHYGNVASFELFFLYIHHTRRRKANISIHSSCSNITFFSPIYLLFWPSCYLISSLSKIILNHRTAKVNNSFFRNLFTSFHISYWF